MEKPQRFANGPGYIGLGPECLGDSAVSEEVRHVDLLQEISARRAAAGLQMSEHVFVDRLEPQHSAQHSYSLHAATPQYDNSPRRQHSVEGQISKFANREDSPEQEVSRRRAFG